MKQKKYLPNQNLPTYCDYTCAYALYATEDSIGACRREQAVYCKLFKKYNKKNALCLGTNSKNK